MKSDDFFQLLAAALVDELHKREDNCKDKLANEFMTTGEVCSNLHISKATLYRHRNLGYIMPAKYIGRKPLYDKNSIDNYLNHFI